jgi:hypothetical protein
VEASSSVADVALDILLVRRWSTLNTRRMAASPSVVDLAFGEPHIFFIPS